MSKKAIITIQLVPESKDVNNKRIEREIRKTLKCDWLGEIEKVEFEESENCMVKKLKKKGLSENVASNVVRFYSG